VIKIFNYARKFAKWWILSPNFVFLKDEFSERRNEFSQQAKIYWGNPLP